MLWRGGKLLRAVEMVVGVAVERELELPISMAGMRMVVGRGTAGVQDVVPEIEQ